MEAKDMAAHKHALQLAAQTASTSYKTAITASILKKILRTGHAPKQFEAHIMTLLDEHWSDPRRGLMPRETPKLRATGLRSLTW